MSEDNDSMYEVTFWVEDNQSSMFVENEEAANELAEELFDIEMVRKVMLGERQPNGDYKLDATFEHIEQ